MTRDNAAIFELASRARSRTDIWAQLLNEEDARSVAEIGVYRGEFAAELLRKCPRIETYYMVDPWRHLDDWNKPANQSDHQFHEFLEETKRRTEFAACKRVILRGRTTEVIDKIPDDSLDFAYIDADHTLHGICIDLIRTWPKVRQGGWIGGDDFIPTIWQQHPRFEPTLVFPFALYFAEAVDARIIALPYWQFLIERSHEPKFEFVDLTGEYSNAQLRDQLQALHVLRVWARQLLAPARTLRKRSRRAAGLVTPRLRRR
jgi:Methyltransferase domain